MAESEMQRLGQDMPITHSFVDEVLLARQRIEGALVCGNEATSLGERHVDDGIILVVFCKVEIGSSAERHESWRCA